MLVCWTTEAGKHGTVSQDRIPSLSRLVQCEGLSRFEKKHQISHPIRQARKAMRILEVPIITRMLGEDTDVVYHAE